MTIPLDASHLSLKYELAESSAPACIPMISVGQKMRHSNSAKKLPQKELGMNWYAIVVKPQAERAVEAALAQKSYETFFPAIASERRWSDRVKRVDLPLFPGYVFCRFDASRRLPVMTTPGVRQIVGFGREAAPVDEAELAALRRALESGAPLKSCEYLVRGDRVEVTDGPMRGLCGWLLETKGNCRVVISVELLQRSVSVEIDRDRIRRMENKMSMTAGGWQ